MYSGRPDWNWKGRLSLRELWLKIEEETVLQKAKLAEQRSQSRVISRKWGSWRVLNRQFVVLAVVAGWELKQKVAERGKWFVAACDQIRKWRGWSPLEQARDQHLLSHRNAHHIELILNIFELLVFMITALLTALGIQHIEMIWGITSTVTFESKSSTVIWIHLSYLWQHELS